MAKQATKEVKDNLNGNTLNVSSKIDAIKELIFGENIQAYNSEFEAVKADILAKKKNYSTLLMMLNQNSCRVLTLLAQM